MTLIETAKAYAIKCHTETNHLYDRQPYHIAHLTKVVEFAEKYAHLIFHQQDVPLAIAVAWTHDTIEDTRQTYNDVKKVCGELVADNVYALTNLRGKTRSERANKEYYIGIRNSFIARYVKICDRLANVSYSKTNGTSTLDTYRKEGPDFQKELWSLPLNEMFYDLNQLLKS